MTLAQFAFLAGADPKWVLNVAAVIQWRRRYSLPMARRLAITHAITEASRIPIPTAYDLAGRALRAPAPCDGVLTIAADANDLVSLRVDIFRILAAVSARQARLATSYQAARRGRRPSRRRDPVRAAAEYGLDVSLLRENIRRTPEERLRQLDAMLGFRANVRRAVVAERRR